MVSITVSEMGMKTSYLCRPWNESQRPVLPRHVSL